MENSKFIDGIKRIFRFSTQWMPDKWYLTIKWVRAMQTWPHFDNPKTFNEKLNWLKMHDRRPIYSSMVDKIEAKKYVAERIGEEYIIPTYGVWDRPEDIDFDSLPDKFIMKCSHAGSEGMCICTDKSKLNYDEVRKGLKRCMSENYYIHNREWPYKNVKPRILAEVLLEDNDNPDLIDYKFCCYNGVVRCSFTCTRRHSNEGLHVTFYDRDWKMMPFIRKYPKEDTPMSKPNNYEKMVDLAEKLSSGIPFLRVDFYDVNGKVYFGELTFFPGGGFEKIEPLEWDFILGSWIEI